MVTFTAAPIVGLNEHWNRTGAPPRYTRTGIPGTLLATKSTLRRAAPMYQRGRRFNPAAISSVYGSDRSVRTVVVRRRIRSIRTAGSAMPTGTSKRISVIRLPPISSAGPRKLIGMHMCSSPTGT